MKTRLWKNSAGAAMGTALAIVVCLPFVSPRTALAQRNDSEVKVARPEGDAVFVQAPIYHRNLAIFPIRRPVMRGPNQGEKYLTLDEGLKQGLVEVREVGANPPPLVRPRPDGNRPPTASLQVQGQSANRPVQQFQSSQSFGGDVNRLLLINHSDSKLILLAGEMVVGGKQDRIVQKDRLVASKDKPTVIEVFCVEQGRWTNTTATFKNAEISGFGGAPKAAVSGGIADPAVRGTAQARREQSAVWEEVGKKNRVLGAAAGETTYQAARTSAQNLKQQEPYLDALEAKVPGTDVVGAIVAVNGKLIWLDEFASAPLFRQYWPKLLRSYVMEALAMRPPPDMEERIRWKLPTIQEAADYLGDRAGNARFEGEEGLYKLLRIENRAHVIYEMTDIDRKDPRVIHTCKMEKK